MKIVIVTASSEIVESIDITDWPLDKPLVRAAFMDDIMDAVDTGLKIENRDREEKSIKATGRANL